MTIEDLEKTNLILFKSIRGSYLFGLETEDSDIDTFGIFCCPSSWLYGTGEDYTPIISDEKNDNYYDELKKFIKEIKKSNPEALTLIFTPPSKILKWNPALQELWDIRDQLLTKASYRSFLGYAKSQISKMHGLSKAMNIDPAEVKERKSPLSFCWVPRPKNDGVWNLKKWLQENGLKQEHCGICRLPNGNELYTLYYDWFADKDLRLEDYARLRYPGKDNFEEIGLELENGKKTTYIKYRGLLDPNCPDTTQLRLSSISKSDSYEPLCTFQYNINAFNAHCKEYREYWNWVKNRNPKRYQDNLGHQWDSKNTMHAIRIMRMGIEILQGKGLLLDRTQIDREELLWIKSHGPSYEEVQKLVIDTENELVRAFENSTLPEEPPQRLLEDIMIRIRKKIYGN